jgi:hypothetical protein
MVRAWVWVCVGVYEREKQSFPKNAWLIDSRLYLKCIMSYGKLIEHKAIGFTIDNDS